MCVLDRACLFSLCLELRECNRLCLLKSQLAGLDVHRNFLEVEFVLVIELVELSDVLEELLFMAFKQFDESVDVGLCCAVLGFESLEVLLSAAEQLAKEALLLFAVALELYEQGCQYLTCLSHILGSYALKSAVSEIGDLALCRSSIAQDRVAVLDIDLVGNRPDLSLLIRCEL